MRYQSYIFLFLFGSLLFLRLQDASKSTEPLFEVQESEGYDGPDQFVEFQRIIRTSPGKLFPDYKAGYKLTELKQAQYFSELQRTKNTFYDWEERGPFNVPGRTRGLSIDSSDPTLQTWYAGSAGGGVWKTTDGGSNWTELTGELSNLATTVVEVAPSDPNTIYVGTGEGFFNVGSIDGDGIFKSTDGGNTWNQLVSTAGQNGFRNINKIIIDPSDANMVLACSNNSRGILSGIYRSIDGGETWETVYSSFNRIQDIVADPTNFNIQYAAINSQGIIKSTDGGITWFSPGKDVFSNGRMSIAVSPVNPDLIFVSAQGSASGSENSDLFVSEDGGFNWSLLKEESGDQVDWMQDQGWYNNTVAAHPSNSNIVYVGGINLYKVELKTGSSQGSSRLKTVLENNTYSYLDFVNAGFSRLRGGFATANEWFSDDLDYPIDTSPTDFVSVEIRFGPGKSQRAHRFIINPGSGTNQDGGAGVAPEDYRFTSYVEVPFEVWDVDNNRQLMVSFRDQEGDGKFNLIERPEDDPVPGREYIFVHAVEYNTTPLPEISIAGGFGYKSIYAMWPTLAKDAIWDDTALPESKIEISYGPVSERTKVTTPLTNPSSVHVDHHNLKFLETSPGNYRMLLATDGGVYATAAEPLPGEQDSDWEQISRGMITGQFYGVDKKPGALEFIGGLQDNGSFQSPRGATASRQSFYDSRSGGDGFDAVWNYKDSQQILISTQFNSIRKSTDGGLTFSQSNASLTDKGSGQAPFFTRLAYHKSVPNRVYTIGNSGVWRTSNFGDSWFVSAINSEWVPSSGITNNYTIEVSKANPSIIWAGGGMTDLIKLQVSVDNGESFDAVNNYNGENFGAISGMGTHPEKDSVAYALFSMADKPKVLRTTDLGSTWTDISGFGENEESSTGFPDVAVYSLLVLPNQTETIWVGTEIGIFESTDNGESWHMLNADIPAVSVWKLVAVDDQIVAATHGRGIWSVTIDGQDWPGEFIVTSVEDDIISNTVKLYPNPVFSQTRLTVELKESSSGSVRVIDISGKTYLERQMDLNKGVNEIQLDLSSLKRGSYLINLNLGNSARSLRLVKL